MAETRSRRSRKVKAVLAGGVVLGIGAAVTLAAWSDSVFSTGTFQTKAWNVQGNVTTDLATAANWQEYATAPGGTLSFTVAANDLTPGDTVYAPISLRVDPAANGYDANVALQAATTSGALAPTLRYAAKTGIAPSACNGGGFTGGVDLVPANSPLATAGTAPFTLVATSSPAVSVCFAVTLPVGSTNAAQTASATWQFAATSVTP